MINNTTIKLLSILTMVLAFYGCMMISWRFILLLSGISFFLYSVVREEYKKQ